MPQHFYPAVLYPTDSDGLHGVVVPGINVNGSGENQQSALADAAAILQQVIDDFASSGEPIPLPPSLDAVDPDGGTVVLMPASVPGVNQRINVMMPQDLLERIEAVTNNRSAFLTEAARAKLAADSLR